MMSRRGLGTAAAALLLARPAHAALAPLHGPVVLTVDGKVAPDLTAGGALFDMQMLDALRQGRFYGETPWTRGKTEFTGPLLSAVLTAAGAKGKSLEMRALNDYLVTVPLADAFTWSVIIATRRDGSAMRIRDKGPLWVVYPMDSDSRLRNEAIYARCAWQLARITVS